MRKDDARLVRAVLMAETLSPEDSLRSTRIFEDPAISAEFAFIVREILAQMQNPHREVLVLRYMARQEPSQVAAFLHLSEPRVRSLVTEGRGIVMQLACKLFEEMAA